MIYDAVVCVGPGHGRLAAIAIRALHTFAAPRQTFVVCGVSNEARLRDALGADARVRFVDEDSVEPDISRPVLDAYLTGRIGSSARAGWYLQQFAKMSLCVRPGMADAVLLWDADTVLLRPLEFFDRDVALVHPARERHAPYFRLMNDVLHIPTSADFSFVAEHLMVRRSFMAEMIGHLGPGWPRRILDGIDTADLGESGFSEYETYGNFVAWKHPGTIRLRRIAHLRTAAKWFGARPLDRDLSCLARAGYTTATFEAWHRPLPLLAPAARLVSRAVHTLTS